MQQNRRPWHRDDYGQWLTTVVKMIVVIGGSTYGGIALDRYLHIHFYLFTIIFSLLAVALAIYILVRDTGKK